MDLTTLTHLHRLRQRRLARAPLAPRLLHRLLGPRLRLRRRRGGLLLGRLQLLQVVRLLRVQLRGRLVRRRLQLLLRLRLVLRHTPPRRRHHPNPAVGHQNTKRKSRHRPGERRRPLGQRRQWPPPIKHKAMDWLSLGGPFWRSSSCSKCENRGAATRPTQLTPLARVCTVRRAREDSHKATRQKREGGTCSPPGWRARASPPPAAATPAAAPPPPPP